MKLVSFWWLNYGGFLKRVHPNHRFQHFSTSHIIISSCWLYIYIYVNRIVYRYSISHLKILKHHTIIHHIWICPQVMGVAPVLIHFRKSDFEPAGFPTISWGPDTAFRLLVPMLEEPGKWWDLTGFFWVKSTEKLGHGDRDQWWMVKWWWELGDFLWTFNATEPQTLGG